jgi:protein phosphatase 1G
MEDAHIAQRFANTDCYVFGVFDGHGGAEVAQFCSKYMPDELEKNQDFQSGKYAASLAGVFHRMDDALRSPEGQAEMQGMRIAATAKGEGVARMGAAAGHGPCPCAAANTDAPPLQTTARAAARARARRRTTCSAS